VLETGKKLGPSDDALDDDLLELLCCERSVRLVEAIAVGVYLVT
jgi:hypothetical protein